MAIKKSNDIANEGSKFANLKGTNSVAKITDRFDDTTHNEHVSDFALQYLNKKLDDVIDETNRGTTASGSYSSEIKILKTASGSFSTMSGSLSTRVTANDAKTGISTAQANSITAGATIVNKTGGTLQFGLSGNNLSVISTVGKTVRSYLIPPQ
tara:strand:- start:2227 stop:2688 length:462 start_codon:yes stop_codon:yes gene_type:complete